MLKAAESPTSPVILILALTALAVVAKVAWKATGIMGAHRKTAIWRAHDLVVASANGGARLARFTVGVELADGGVGVLGTCSICGGDVAGGGEGVDVDFLAEADAVVVCAD